MKTFCDGGGTPQACMDYYNDLLKTPEGRKKFYANMNDIQLVVQTNMAKTFRDVFDL